MKLTPVLLLLFEIFNEFPGNCQEEEKVFKVAGLDSYLEAYRVTREQNNDNNEAGKKSDTDFQDPFPSNGGYPQHTAPNYGPPLSQYGPPHPPPNYAPSYPPPNYGPPHPPPNYGPPNYGPPNYGPPAPPAPPLPPPVYGPPSSHVQVFYGVPHALGTIWDKLKFKLDLFTIGKIILKLVLFKKFISFIAIIFLLLFIPWLKNKDKPIDGDGTNGDSYFKRRSIYKEDKKLDEIMSYVMDAIDNFSKKEKYEKCNSMFCNTQNVPTQESR